MKTIMVKITRVVGAAVLAVTALSLFAAGLVIWDVGTYGAPHCFPRLGAMVKSVCGQMVK